MLEGMGSPNPGTKEFDTALKLGWTVWNAVVKADMAALGLEQPGHQEEKAAFAAAIGPVEANFFAGLEGEGGVLQQLWPLRVGK